MRYRLLCLLLLPLSTLLQAAEPLLIDAELWSTPRTAERIIALDGLAERVLKMAADEQLVIDHPAGEEGVLWAQELRGWLVALGVSSAQIKLQVSEVSRDSLQLSIESISGNQHE